MLDCGGPPAVEALLEDSYTVIAHDSAFQDGQIKEEYEKQNMCTIPVYFKEPKDLIEYAWDTKSL